MFDDLSFNDLENAFDIQSELNAILHDGLDDDERAMFEWHVATLTEFEVRQALRNKAA